MDDHVEIRDGSGNVTALLLVDSTTGAMAYYADLKSQSYRGTMRKIAGNPAVALAAPDGNFPHQAAARTPRRFVPVPLFNGSGATQDVLILDTGTGAMAVLKGALQPRKAKVQPVRKNLYNHLPAGVGRPRVWTAVPKVAGNGATDGA